MTGGKRTKKMFHGVRGIGPTHRSIFTSISAEFPFGHEVQVSGSSAHVLSDDRSVPGHGRGAQTGSLASREYTAVSRAEVFEAMFWSFFNVEPQLNPDWTLSRKISASGAVGLETDPTMAERLRALTETPGFHEIRERTTLDMVRAAYAADTFARVLLDMDPNGASDPGDPGNQGDPGDQGDGDGEDPGESGDPGNDAQGQSQGGDQGDGGNDPSSDDGEGEDGDDSAQGQSQGGASASGGGTGEAPAPRDPLAASRNRQRAEAARQITEQRLDQHDRAMDSLGKDWEDLSRDQRDAGVGADLEDGKRTSLPRQVQGELKVANQLAKNPIFRNATQVYGRFQALFKRVRRDSSRVRHPDVVGVEWGTDVSRALPVELALDDDLFYLRLANGGLALRKEKRRNDEGRGHVVVLLDRSASMNAALDDADMESRDNSRMVWANGVVLTLCRALMGTNREVYLVQFAAVPSHSQRILSPKLSKDISLLDLLPFGIATGGGTNFAMALDRGISVVDHLGRHEPEMAKKTDILVITDGEDGYRAESEVEYRAKTRGNREIPEDNQEIVGGCWSGSNRTTVSAFAKAAEELGARVHAVSIGCGSSLLRRICDRTEGTYVSKATLDEVSTAKTVDRIVR